MNTQKMKFTNCPWGRNYLGTRNIFQHIRLKMGYIEVDVAETKVNTNEIFSTSVNWNLVRKTEDEQKTINAI